MVITFRAQVELNINKQLINSYLFTLKLNYV